MKDMSMEDNRNLDLLASWIRESKYTVVLTGAGMSTESGIPDFRSKDGWWKKLIQQLLLQLMRWKSSMICSEIFT